MGPLSRAALVVATNRLTMSNNLRTDLETYRNRLDELGRFL
ncbi:hypothetical protein FHS01_004682 [Longimicrobium terrae]|uniref:Uncharacterized protein n=1 Tax=Longimicrobium terrae TaxID=1639882 RepID=A0A841H507_9BACT|nr:hypothetical protein [Longimicrobium terrae]MBB6072859.1 hypothetical protein [Longimicrobium terrae]